MNNEEQVLVTLQKLLEVQEQTLVIQKQAFENQRQAVANQQIALRNQLATGRIYRVTISIVAIIFAGIFYFLFRAWR